MFIVTITNNGIETVIHGDVEKLQSGKIVKGINSIDSFSFSILPSNIGFGLIREFSTLVSVYNTNQNRYEFIGRVLYPETSMSDSGLIVKTVTCESIFGYLCDSVQKYFDTKNWTVEELLRQIITCHNSQVEEYKRFNIGNITVSDDNDNIYIGIQRENTWDTLKSKLVDKIGGEFQYRYENDKIYIDYLDKIGETKGTEIALSVNMKSITREQDPTEFVTRLIPLGAKTSKDSDSEERLDITSVNGGVEYIDDESAIELYGVHVGVQTWDDVTTPAILLTKARNWLSENNKVQVKYSITALDLSLLGLVFEDFDVGNYHPIKNSLLGIDDVARIIKKNIDICEEIKSTIEVGDNFKTLSDIQQEQAKNAAAELVLVTQKVQSANNELKNEVSNNKNEIQKLYEEIAGIEGANIYVRYSANADGSNMTETVEDDTRYMGLCGTSSAEAPTDAADYTWCMIGTQGEDGEDGKDGRGIEKTEVYYYLSASSTALMGGSWSTTPPEWVDGRYYWQKTISTYTDGTTTESEAVCITGGKGATGKDGQDGTNGVGVESIKAQFYLSTSSEELTGGEWVDTMPDWDVGVYLWTRSVITYTDESVQATEPLCDTAWEAAEAVRSDLQTTITNQETSLTNTCTEIVMQALEGYVKTNDYQAFRETVEAQFSIMYDEISIRFLSTVEQLENNYGELQDKFTTINKYFTFSENGIMIGSGDNAITLQLDSDNGIVFCKDGEAFGRWDGVDFYTGNIVVEVNKRAQLGNFAFVPRSDGSLTFLKVGG